MAFDKKYLRAFSSAGAASAAGETGQRFWHYKHPTDDWATIGGAGYWNGARSYVKPGDPVFISGDLGGTPFFRQLMFATVPASGNVTVTELAVTHPE
ncbi:hypothetical protein KHC23_07750 [Ancylobacter dichloromethanicus]|uniref:Uncharacterized protein n=1 Tax=Ancylobacter dichloromethanicus TaxID=518825 RepID=A0A9W6JAU6_9HYPH|nr:hypothetical protein [Ancylobacter dichloromethanicus]MBS7553540.1 hypothetical protein [Ancylobacter dichloromethanicus]GLK72599.1 hypothetical protein GCM10017643_27150 [Ancylobacter dichloromethanicus]